MNTSFAISIDIAIRDVLRRELPFFRGDDIVTVERMPQDIRIVYSSAQTSDSPSDPTVLKLRLRPDVREMWIGDLRVSVPFRGTGLGRRLVSAAEEIARETGMTEVNVFPLSSAWGFWLKMEYAPHRHIARVLSKPVDPDSCMQIQTGQRAREPGSDTAQHVA